MRSKSGRMLELALICSIANSSAGMLDSLYLKPPSAPLSVVRKEKRSGTSGETDGKASSENTSESSIPLPTSFSLLSPSRPLWSSSRLVRYSDASLQTMRLAAFVKKRASAIFILSRRLRAHEGDSARVLNGGWLSACVTNSGGRFDCSMRVVGQCNMQQTCHITCVHIWEIAVEQKRKRIQNVLAKS